MYFITTFETIEPSDLGFVKVGDSRTPGYYPEKQMAVNALHENRCDLWETIYDYAVIEKIGPGLYQYAMDENRQFFKWDDERKGFFEIDEPVEFAHRCGFGIG